VKVYLAGPMRHRPDFNFPAFRAATSVLRSIGYEVWSPHEDDEANGFTGDGHTGQEDVTDITREGLAADLAYIARDAEMVVVLPGWEDSLGVAAEMATARAVGIPVLTYEEITEALSYADGLA
jgi:nucleoside 2-deoxyribosyltransferase